MCSVVSFISKMIAGLSATVCGALPFVRGVIS